MMTITRHGMANGAASERGRRSAGSERNPAATIPSEKSGSAVVTAKNAAKSMLRDR